MTYNHKWNGKIFQQEEMARYIANAMILFLFKLLQFTTGCLQLPPGGFKDLSPHFQITPASQLDSTHLVGIY